METQIGIRITYNKEAGTPLFADFWIEEGIPSKEFLTNQTIRKTIRESPYSVGCHLGVMILKKNPKGNKACWVRYNPFPCTDLWLGKKGIAQLLEYRVLQKFREQHPTVSQVKHIDPSQLRIGQLQRRGLNPNCYSFKNAIKKLRKKIAKDARKTRRP
jgi:predicted GNAT family acetyltransferase